MAQQARCADCGAMLTTYPWLTEEVRPKLLVYCGSCDGGEMYDYDLADREATVPRPAWLRRGADRRRRPKLGRTSSDPIR